MIQVVTLPDPGPIITRPRNNPIYDRVWLGGGGRVSFFREPIGAADADGHVKTPADTNLIMQPFSENAAPLPRGWAMHAYGLYMCPCLREVPEERYPEVRRQIAAVRWGASCSLRFGANIYAEIPAACVLANLAGGAPEVEAVPLPDNPRAVKWRRRDGSILRGEWPLTARDPQGEDDLVSQRQFPLTIQRYPLELMADEDWHVRLEDVPPGLSGHVRGFVNGILLKGLEG